MSVSSVTAAPANLTVQDLSTARGENAAPADAFAQLFASLLNANVPKPDAPEAVDGTSELDKPEVDKPELAGEEKKGSDAAPTTDPSVNAASASSNEIVRSLAALDPQLQAKLARVMTRVREETGHDVRVAETYRSQARQNQLFAQGRSAAGQVVTWTQHSKHTEGRAVDVQLDSGAAGGDAYRALQRIANEEGLATLGPRDPGHLELRGRGQQVNADAAAATTNEIPITLNARPPRMGQVAEVAQGPQVARVAKVAEVAHVAEVARVAPAAAPRAGGGKTSSGSGNDSRGGYTLPGVTFAAREPNTQSQTVNTVVAPAGVDGMARAERVMAARDSAPARPLSQITMHVDAGNGSTDRVHVSMRGTALNTTIDTSDARAAQVMTAKTDELARALDKQGVELESMRVRTTESTTAVNGAGASQASGGNTDSYSHSRFDRSEAWQQHQDQQDQQDRGRSSQQQRDERRGYRDQRDSRGGRK